MGKAAPWQREISRESAVLIMKILVAVVLI